MRVSDALKMRVKQPYERLVPARRLGRGTRDQQKRGPAALKVVLDVGVGGSGHRHGALLSLKGRLAPARYRNFDAHVKEEAVIPPFRARGARPSCTGAEASACPEWVGLVWEERKGISAPQLPGERPS